MNKEVIEKLRDDRGVVFGVIIGLSVLIYIWLTRMHLTDLSGEKFLFLPLFASFASFVLCKLSLWIATRDVASSTCSRDELLARAFDQGRHKSVTCFYLSRWFAMVAGGYLSVCPLIALTIFNK